MVKIIFLLVLVCLSSPSYGEIIYQWVDKNGTYNFTDDPEKIPSTYLKEVRQKVIEDILETKPSLPPAKPISTEKEVIKGMFSVWERNGGEERRIHGRNN